MKNTYLILFIAVASILAFYAGKSVQADSYHYQEQIMPTEGNYTLITDTSYIYIKSFWVLDNRIYYVKDNGKQGNIDSIKGRLEEGWLPAKELPLYTGWEYTE